MSIIKAEVNSNTQVGDILIRRVYKHFKGGMYVVHGLAIHEKTQEEMVIYADIFTGKVFTREKSSWFDLHPDLQVPRFQLFEKPIV